MGAEKDWDVGGWVGVSEYADNKNYFELVTAYDCLPLFSAKLNIADIWVHIDVFSSFMVFLSVNTRYL